MTNIFERQVDILKIIKSLDITPTMYKRAVDSYRAISRFLEGYGIEADMYPQGSFAFGTVVRPQSGEQDAAYDLDFICQLKYTRDETSASELRDTIGDALKSSDQYGGKLVVYDKCFTVEYAAIDGVGFNIDIVPATDESEDNKARLFNISKRPDLINTAIAIPRHIGKQDYEWLTNNPKGFRVWFDEINKPFLDFHRDSIRKSLYLEHRAVYASIEEIPSQLERSPIQRVIQILKLHRNFYYNRRKDGDKLKPNSAIINTLVANISASVDPRTDTFDLLRYVVSELAIYSNRQSLHESEFTKRYGMRTIIAKSIGGWRIENPANPEDNLADEWNRNSDIPKAFFAWIGFVKNDLLDSLSLPSDEFRSIIDSAFSSAFVNKRWSGKYRSITPKPIITSPKPYRAYRDGYSSN